jgi:hypothetical protein
MVGVGCLIPNMVSLLTAWHRRRMLLMSLWTLWLGIWAHSSIIACLSSWTVAGWTCREDMAFCSILQACLIGFKSLGLTSQSMRTIVASSRYRLLMWSLCARALSSIWMKSGPTTPAYVRTWTSKTLLTYVTAVSVPFSMMCRSVYSRPHHD